MSKPLTYIDCNVIVGVDSKYYTKDTGVHVFTVLADGTKRDERPNPPFLAMSPCPYCGAVQDRGHFPMGHVNPAFGTRI